MQSKVIQLYTLTPLWSGDIDRNSALPRETSFVGSLRWWYREIIRSRQPDSVCDETSDNAELRCPRRKLAKEKQVCRVCSVFGCTGQARRFRIEIEELMSYPLFFATHNDAYGSNGNWLTRMWGGIKTGRGRDASFTFAKDCLFVEAPRTFRVKITPRSPSEQGSISQITTLMRFIGRYGALGARTQNGFGQIKIAEESGNGSVEELSPTRESFFSLTFELAGGLGRFRESIRFVGSAPPGMRDLRRALFVPCAFDLRYRSSAPRPSGFDTDLGLRPYFKKRGYGRETVKTLFGRSAGTKSKSCIHVSHLFREKPGGNFRLKIFGFIPEILKGKVKADDIGEVVKNFVTSEAIFPNSEVVDRF